MIAFDTAPLTQNLTEIADYTALKLYSAVSAQLYRWRHNDRRLIRSACKNETISKDFCCYEVLIRPDLTWQNGAQITANHYAASIQNAIDTCAPVSHRLGQVKEIQVYKSHHQNCNNPDILRILLSNPDRNFIYKLAHPALGPLAEPRMPEIRPFASGPYEIRKWTKHGGTIIQRHTSAQTLKRPRELDFIYVQSPEAAVTLYDRRIISSTCPVSFPLYRLEELKSREDFHTCASNTYLTLVPVSDRALATDFRKATGHCINIEKVLQLFTGGLNVWRSFSDSDPNPKRPSSPNVAPKPQISRHEIQYLAKCCSDRPLLLSYDDYHPNKQIAYEICSQFERKGIRARSTQDEFRNPSTECDFKLSVLMNSLSYPADIYRRLAKSPIIQSCAITQSRYVNALDRFDIGDCQSEQKLAIDALDRIIVDEKAVIPIARLNQFYLMRPRDSVINWESSACWDK